MNSSVKIGGGVIAACAACCAVSVVPAFLAGTSLAAVSAAAWTWGGGLAALAIVAAGGGVLYLARRKPATTARNANLLIGAAREHGCGCGAAASEKTPIACTLGAEDFKQRTADIRELARRALRDSKRTPLSLTLTYAPEAADELRVLMAKEQECCPFLTFGLKQTADAVELAIIAPPSAREAADALFDHFAPELAASKIKEIA